MAAPSLAEQVAADELSAEALWRDLLEKDDRTSPAEYPDMALITQDEFVAVFERELAEFRVKFPP